MSFPSRLPFDARAPAALALIYAKMGGRYTIGALRLCGCPEGHLLYRFPADGDHADPAFRGQRFSIFEHGTVFYDLGFEFPAFDRHGPRSLGWVVTVAAEPDRTHSIYLTAAGTLVASKRFVPDDNTLCNAIVSLHTSACTPLPA